MKKSKAVVILAIIAIALGLLCWFSTTIITDTMKRDVADSEGNGKSANAIILGLDLSGGVSVTYEIVTEGYTDSDVEDTKAKLEERAASYTTEYSVYKSGDNRITVEIPGANDPDEVLANLGKPGSLYFVRHQNADKKDNYTYDSATGEYVLAEGVTIEKLVESGDAFLDGSGVREAQAGYDQDSLGNKEPVVDLTLTDEAASIWEEETKKAAQNNSDSIGIFYDDHFVCCPTVSASKNPNGISGGRCTITFGNKNTEEAYKEAEELATFIRIGAISLELEELQSSVVGAQLGGEAISSSLLAAAIGLALVMIFMIVMYGISGVAADIALACYTVIVLSVIQLYEITLTLPGIAGIILGIGMAVDANVIVFARIREEIASGKTVGASIKEGYHKAFSAILDGNITTFIAALVLLILGSGTVRGFAYTLMISIVASMFTALVVARWVMYSLYALGCKSEKLYGRAKERKTLNFIKHKVVYFIISLALIVVGFVSMGAFSANSKGALNYGIEFAGGTSTSATMDKAYSVEELESEVVPEIEKITGDTNVQATAVDGGKDVVIKTRTLSEEESTELRGMLSEKFGVDEDTVEMQTISSTISSEMRRSAIIAVIVACVFMLLYIWLRFRDLRFALSAILALVHDVLIVLTAYAVFRFSVGNTFIACMLTIVGYSINDTIVIFDRIRENMKGHSHFTRETLAAVANKSLTQTLSRSINTSITTIIMVLMLCILGVSSIKTFAFPLLVGMICGSYSSIFIATQLWYVMKCRFGKKRIKE